MNTTTPSITLIRATDVNEQTAQTGNVKRLVGVGDFLPGADRIWMGRVRNTPGQWSSAHHHGEAQTAGFLLSGRARIYFGDDYLQFVDMEPGDFCWVPPYVPHVEGNLSETEPCEFLTARTPGNIVVNLEVDGYAVHEAQQRREGR